jgi:hypothetical protein
MANSVNGKFDLFLSRRGSVAAIAREVTDALTEKGYKVLVQDYDIPLGASFVEAMHEAIINSRDLIILFTEDYLRSPYPPLASGLDAGAVFERVDRICRSKPDYALLQVAHDLVQELDPQHRNLVRICDPFAPVR